MTSSAPPFKALAGGLILLATSAVSSACLAIVALGLGELDQAKVWGVIAGLSTSATQALLTYAGYRTFTIWRRQQAEWINEWGLIQQELARRREYGD